MAEDPSRRDIIRLASLGLAVGSLGCGDDGSARAPDGGSLDVGPDADPACAATGPQTAGPYYPGEPATRMNIVEDRQGVALQLTLTVLARGSCEALANAEVDVWTADSSGDYSGYQVFDTVGATWLRGQQSTSASGTVLVEGIVPGSYPGRAVHVHIKVRAAGRNELTTQLYFPDAVIADVLAEPEYQGAEQTLNGSDTYYAPDTLMEVSGDNAAGYVASATVYL